MLWIGIIFLAASIYFAGIPLKERVIYIIPKDTEPKFYYKELTEEELNEVADHVLKTLKLYHDAYVGEIYPELVYQAINYLYDMGELSKEQYEFELKKLTDKIII